MKQQLFEANMVKVSRAGQPTWKSTQGVGQEALPRGLSRSGTLGPGYSKAINTTSTDDCGNGVCRPQVTLKIFGNSTNTCDERELSDV